MTSLDIVKNYYESFNSKNWKGMVSLLHPEIRHEANQGE